MMKIGDRVKHNPAFLQSIFNTDKNLAKVQGIVVELEPMSEKNALASVVWDDPYLPQKILTSNLKKVK